MSGDFLDSISREAFNTAHEISAYSLPALAKAARPMMQGRNAAIVALSYLGAVRAIPNYNVMGMAKASLEAGTRDNSTAVVVYAGTQSRVTLTTNVMNRMIQPVRPASIETARRVPRREGSN